MNGKEESPGYIETILNELQGKTPLNAGCLPETEMEVGEFPTHRSSPVFPFALL